MSALPDPAKLPKQQYSVVLDLEAPIEACFVATYAEEAMMAWVPNPRSVVYDHSKATHPYGPGSARLVTLKSGTSLVEVIFLSEKPTLVGYCIPRFGFGIDALIKNYQGRISLQALGPMKTHLTWNGYFDCPGWRRPLEPLFRLAMRTLIATMAGKMKPYVESTQSRATA